MSKCLSLLISFIKGRFFMFSAVAVFLTLAGLWAYQADAQIFQFKPGDKNYLAALAALAAEEAKSDVNIEEKVQNDEDFKPEDFGLQGVGILPDSPFYFLKNARRGVTSFFTFDPAKKAERNLQFASEKLLEAKTLAEREGADAEDVKYALDNFQKEMDKVQGRVENAAEKLDKEKAEDLSKKVMDSVVKYGKSLSKLEKELPPEVFGEVKEVKDKNSETFGAVFKLVEPEKVSEKLVEVLDEQKGSEFKQFKNLEILKDVKDKIPEGAKDAIRVVEDDSFLKLQNGLEHFDSGQKALFEDFVRETGGSELRHLEIINELEARPLSKELRDSVSKAKENTLSKAEDRLSKLSTEQKGNFFEHLSEGNLEDVRVIKELENSVGSELLSSVTDVKNQVTQNFVKKIEDIKSEGKQKQDLLAEVGRFHDAKSIAILDEIKGLIPEDKKGVFEEIKKRAADEIKRDISQARNSQQREIILSALAGDHPEEAEAVERFRAEVDRSLRGVFAGLQDAILKGIQAKVENIDDKDRLLKFEDEFKKRADLFRNSSQDVKNINNFFSDRKVIFESPDRAQRKIDEVRKYANDLRDLASSLPLDVAYQSGGFDPAVREVERLLQLVERKLDVAENSLGYNDVGRAYGEAQAAESIARDGIRLAQEFKTGKKRAETQVAPFAPLIIDGGPGYKKGGNFMIYNPYEFSQYCFYVQGFLKGPLSCGLRDGRVFSAEGKPFPFSIPPDFVPRRIDTSGREACPVIFTPSYDFCTNGKVVYERDQRGCETSPRCESYGDGQTQVRLHPTDKSLCGGIAGYQCVQGYKCQYPDTKTSDAFGKCVADVQYTCQAEWKGFVFDQTKKTCREESATACSNPFTYKTVSECEGANGIGESTPKICPALYSVESCPAGQKKVVIHTSAGCGDYYGCELEKTPVGISYPHTFTNGFVARDYASAKAQCLANPPGSGGGIAAECETKFGISYGTPTPSPTTGNWVKKVWYFSDGMQETSFVLNRTDSEYQNYLSEVEAQCRTITRSKFAWKSGAGDDRGDNWRNFGIPDCSGSAVVSGGQCSDGKDNDNDGQIDYPKDTGCYSAEDNDESAGSVGDANSCPNFSYSRWDSTGKRYCQLNTVRSCQYSYPAYTDQANYKPENCPANDSGTTPGSNCTSYTDSSACNANSGCTWNMPSSGSPYCQVKSSTQSSVPAPYSLTATLASNGKDVNLKWNNIAPSPTEFKIWRKAGGSGWSFLTTFRVSGEVGIGNYFDANVPTGTADYMVQVCNSSGCSPDSNVGTVGVTGGTGTNPSVQCSDGIDNDNDGKIDYPADTGCYSASDNDETIPATGSGPCVYYTQSTCDADTVCKWVAGFGCGSKAQCNDGIDNDNDGKIDYPADTSCSDSFANNEGTASSAAKCHDGIDNDGDGKIDYPQDPGCYGAEDNDEVDVVTPTVTVPAAPDNLSYSLGSSGNATLTWTDNATNETSYYIKRKSSDGTWSTFGSMGIAYGGSVTYTVTAPVPSAFEYRVEACNSAGCSTPSNSVIVTLAAPACSSPGSCTNSADCSSSGYFWCSNVNGCYSGSSSCPSTSTTACNNNGTCEAGESTGSCPSDCGSYTGGGTSSSCSTPSNCFNSSICTSSGWYWYNNGCWSSPQTTSQSTSCPSGQYWNGTSCVTSTYSGGSGCGSWPSQSDCTSHSGCSWNSTGNYCYAQ